MRPPAWFRFWPTDFLADHRLRSLTAEQRGWWLQLRCEAWRRQPQCSLPTDPGALWRLAGASSRKKFERESGPMLECFELRDGFFWDVLGLSEAAHIARYSEGGKLTAQLRWNQQKGDSRLVASSELANSQSCNVDTDLDKEKEKEKDSEQRRAASSTAGGPDGRQRTTKVKSFLSKVKAQTKMPEPNPDARREELRLQAAIVAKKFGGRQ